MAPYDALCRPLLNCQLHTLPIHQVPQPAHSMCDLMRCGFDEWCPLLLHVIRFSCGTGVYDLTYTIVHGVKSWCEHLNYEHTPPGKSLPPFWESVAAPTPTLPRQECYPTSPTPGVPPPTIITQPHLLTLLTREGSLLTSSHPQVLRHLFSTCVPPTHNVDLWRAGHHHTGDLPWCPCSYPNISCRIHP